MRDQTRMVSVFVILLSLIHISAQAMSLVTGLVPDKYREKVTERLRKDIVNRNYAVTAGDIGPVSYTHLASFTALIIPSNIHHETGKFLQRFNQRPVNLKHDNAYDQQQDPHAFNLQYADAFSS